MTLLPRVAGALVAGLLLLLVPGPNVDAFQEQLLLPLLAPGMGGLLTLLEGSELLRRNVLMRSLMFCFIAHGDILATLLANNSFVNPFDIWF